jgi:hypothetical protein
MIGRSLIGVVISGVLLIGVAGCGGGGAEVRKEGTTTTEGQQLLDLKKALDAGAMAQKEQEQQRAKALNAQ